MKVVTVVGARPQFIKAAVVSRMLRERHNEVLIHTGQHYDENMSGVFFKELGIPEADYNIGIGSGRHGAQTGAMMEGIERILLDEQPDWMLVYGDTNSTLAGALAAAKLQIRVAHVEAGLRSFNRAMPEEINRILTDHISDLLFCPSQVAADQLRAEGITQGVHIIGDVMYEALLYAVQQVGQFTSILSQLGLVEKQYLLATVHRAENSDDPSRLKSILEALNRLDETVIFPVHPRTRKAIDAVGFVLATNIHMINPVGYLDMVCLERSARMILTDSGGIQKEAYWLEVPCVTLRNETEWIETVECGWNWLVGSDIQKIVNTVKNFVTPPTRPSLYSDGHSARRCVSLLTDFHGA